MKKIWFLGLTSALCLALFTGCAGSADTMPQPTAQVTTPPMATAAPTSTAGPTASSLPSAAANAADALMPGASPGVNTVEDARRVSEKVSEEVDRLSEVDDAEAVVAGGIALVGLSYEAEYQGGLTDRLRQMVTERAEMADKSITTVHVTDEEEAVRKIETLYERLKDGGITYAELQTEVLDISGGLNGGAAPAPTAGTSAGKK